MQGGGISNAGNLTLTTTLLHNNTPDDLDNTQGSAYYVLPAPPGRYIEGVVHCTQQLCPPDNNPCPIQNCLPANYGNMTAILPQRPLTEAELLPNCSAGFYANRTLSADQRSTKKSSSIEFEPWQRIMVLIRMDGSDHDFLVVGRGPNIPFFYGKIHSFRHRLSSNDTGLDNLGGQTPGHIPCIRPDLVNPQFSRDTADIEKAETV